MTEREKEKISWFKGLMKSYYAEDAMISSLNNKIAGINSMFDVRSPSLSDIRISPPERTEQLAKYSDLKARFENALQGVQQNHKTTEDIMNLIDDQDVRNAIEDVYGRGKTMVGYAYRVGYTPSGFKYHVERTLLDAINKYEKGEE